MWAQPPLGGCVLKQPSDNCRRFFIDPAAFRRLCVETLLTWLTKSSHSPQPPLGGCVLKRWSFLRGLCLCIQPPLGGCVLKPPLGLHQHSKKQPAAFRRLCVETTGQPTTSGDLAPAAFRRLCVETTAAKDSALRTAPAAFRRLCVETNYPKKPLLN